MARRTNQKFQQYDLVRLKERIPWIYRGGEVVEYRPDSGKLGIVVGSYYDQFGGGKRERTQYTIRFEDSGDCSWYDDEHMELVEEGRTDLFEAWGEPDYEDYC